MKTEHIGDTTMSHMTLADAKNLCDEHEAKMERMHRETAERDARENACPNCAELQAKLDQIIDWCEHGLGECGTPGCECIIYITDNDHGCVICPDCDSEWAYDSDAYTRWATAAAQLMEAGSDAVS